MISLDIHRSSVNGSLKIEKNDIINLWPLIITTLLEGYAPLKGLLYSGKFEAGIKILIYSGTPALRRSLIKRCKRFSFLYG